MGGSLKDFGTSSWRTRAELALQLIRCRNDTWAKHPLHHLLLLQTCHALDQERAGTLLLSHRLGGGKFCRRNRLDESELFVFSSWDGKLNHGLENIATSRIKFSSWSAAHAGFFGRFGAPDSCEHKQTWGWGSRCSHFWQLGKQVIGSNNQEKETIKYSPLVMLTFRTSLSFSPSSLCEHSSSDHNYLGLCSILLAHSPMSRWLVVGSVSVNPLHWSSHYRM